MKKFIKRSTAVISIITAVIFSLVIYGEKKLPDSMSTVGSDIVFSGIYKTSFDRETVYPVSNMSGKPETVFSSSIKLFGAIPVKNVNIEKTDRRYVAVGGDLIGIRLQTQGVLVVGFDSFESTAGTVSPAEKAGIKQGDILVNIGGTAIKDNASLCRVIENCKGNELEVTVIREGEEIKLTLCPEVSKITGLYKGGLWIRDSTGGIGTMTFLDVYKGTIASLGHGIYDVDTGTLMSAQSGSLGDARLSGVTKGESGNAGELRGSIGPENYGTVLINCENGIYGTLNHYNKDIHMVPVALCSEVKTGKAQIVSTVSGSGKQYYDIEIEKIDISAENKNMVIKITDKELIDMTGGIVQGMSGSPIIQDGMLVGAVTHVFLNDPTKGYAILAETMLEIADNTLEDFCGENAA